MTRPLILALDVAGLPHRWINYENACYYYAKDLVAWSMGQNGRFTVYGGISGDTGNRSFLDIDTIIAIKGQQHNAFRHNNVPPLTNRALFRRDNNMCAYCGTEYSGSKLTRDHVIPKRMNGPNTWENVVTACGSCNRRKGDKLPERAGMPLLYVPYAPNRSEFLILSNRRILADQMEFLLKTVGKNSRLHDQPIIEH